MRAVAALLMSLAVWLCAVDAEAAAARVALIIGNGKYQGAPELPNPPRDATAVAATLKKLGFEVILATDVDRRKSIEAIDKFTRDINGASIALLFFAGHGIQIGGQNFLLPTDVSVESERALRYSAIDIQEVVSEMERRAEVAIGILDACRDNPFLAAITRSTGTGTRAAVAQRGLGPMRLSGRGALIAYAAASGDVAADGAGQHSPFTAALLAEVSEPNVEVGLRFRRVARRVIDETKGDQHPELLVRLVDEVYLNPTDGAKTLVATTPSATVPSATQPATAPVVVADARRQATVGGNGDQRFFGDRVVHPPPWAEGVAAPKPGSWRSVAAQPVAEAAGNDSYGNAQRLPLAAAVQGRIQPKTDSDWYQIEVPTAGELRVDVDPAPPELDLHARVWNANHEVVADWQGATRPGAVLAARLPLPTPGRYWIEIRDGNNDQESGQQFTAKIDFAPADDPSEPNNNLGAAAAMPPAVQLSPTIYPVADADWYKVWIPSPGLFTVVATRVPQALDVAMRVWNLNGAVVRDWVVPQRKGGDTVLEAELAAPGVYLVETADANNDASSVDPFKLTFEFRPVPDEAEPDNTFGTALVVEPTSQRKIAIFPRTDNDWFAFDVDHPGELKFTAMKSPKNLDVHMRIWTSDKQVLRDWIGPPRPGGDVEGFADLPAAGRYFIEIVDGNNDQSSPDLFDFALSFTPAPDQYEANNAPVDATPLTAGGKILFNILPLRDVDWFRIEAPAAGELAIVIDESPPNLDLHFRVWDANRQVVRDWVPPYRKGGVTEGFADLPRAGAYFVEVVDGNNDERSVLPATLATTFTPIADAAFEPNNRFGQARPLKPGEAVMANILPRGDADWYLLQAPSAGSFVVTADQVDQNLDVYVRLWNAEAAPGNWIGPPRPGGVTDAQISVPGPGQYRLEVADGNNDQRSKKPFRLKVDFK